jgi:hypothetical protein
MADLFDALGAEPGGGNPPAPQADPEPAVGESQVLAEAEAGPGGAEEIIEEAAGEEAEPEGAIESADGDEPVESGAAPASDKAAETKPAEQKPVNVVEEDPYDFDRCLITIAIALMPDDENPDGRMVTLGVRNHQDEPILATCRLSDLAPLPDPVQQLLERLREQLPALSAKAAERKKKVEEARKKAAEGRSKPATGKAAPEKAKKAEKPKPTSLNLFDMFDQPSK